MCNRHTVELAEATVQFALTQSWSYRQYRRLEDASGREHGIQFFSFAGVMLRGGIRGGNQADEHDRNLR
jgi:hypothetical protein